MNYSSVQLSCEHIVNSLSELTRLISGVPTGLASFGERGSRLLTEVNFVVDCSILLVVKVLSKGQSLATCCKEGALGECFQVVCIGQGVVGLLLCLIKHRFFHFFDLSLAAGDQTQRDQIELFVCLLGEEAKSHDDVASDGRVVSCLLDSVRSLHLVLDKLVGSGLQEVAREGFTCNCAVLEDLDRQVCFLGRRSILLHLEQSTGLVKTLVAPEDTD